MKRQVLGSIALLALASPILFAAPPPPAKQIGVNLALRDTATKPTDDELCPARQRVEPVFGLDAVSHVS
jgi:hypothetical protein